MAFMAQDLIRFMQSLFPPAGKPGSTGVWQPPADIYRTRRGWLVKLDLAGVRPEDVQVTVHGDCLTVRGIRRDCSLEEGCRHYQMEIAYSTFERSLTLPVNLDRARVEAEHRQGMLLIHIRPEAEQR
jgi:HSP20 family protein